MIPAVQKNKDTPTTKPREQTERQERGAGTYTPPTFCCRWDGSSCCVRCPCSAARKTRIDCWAPGPPGTGWGREGAGMCSWMTVHCWCCFSGCGSARCRWSSRWRCCLRSPSCAWGRASSWWQRWRTGWTLSGLLETSALPSDLHTMFTSVWNKRNFMQSSRNIKTAQTGCMTELLMKSLQKSKSNRFCFAAFL